MAGGARRDSRAHGDQAGAELRPRLWAGGELLLHLVLGTYREALQKVCFSLLLSHKNPGAPLPNCAPAHSTMRASCCWGTLCTSQGHLLSAFPRLPDALRCYVNAALQNQQKKRVLQANSQKRYRIPGEYIML